MRSDCGALTYQLLLRCIANMITLQVLLSDGFETGTETYRDDWVVRPLGEMRRWDCHYDWARVTDTVEAIIRNSNEVLWCNTRVKAVVSKFRWDKESRFYKYYMKRNYRCLNLPTRYSIGEKYTRARLIVPRVRNREIPGVLFMTLFWFAIWLVTDEYEKC